MPEGKVEAVKRLREGGRKVAFVGDGINDAPALAEADVGLAIGTGTDVAIESADVVLMSGDLNGVPNAIGLSKATIRNIGQNLFWAFAYNVLLIPVAAGALYPFTGTLLSPMLAAGAMALSSVFVLGNAMRLKRFRAPLVPLIATQPRARSQQPNEMLARFGRPALPTLIKDNSYDYHAQSSIEILQHRRARTAWRSSGGSMPADLPFSSTTCVIPRLPKRPRSERDFELRPSHVIDGQIFYGTFRRSVKGIENALASCAV